MKFLFFVLFLSHSILISKLLVVFFFKLLFSFLIKLFCSILLFFSKQKQLDLLTERFLYRFFGSFVKLILLLFSLFKVLNSECLYL